MFRTLAFALCLSVVVPLAARADGAVAVTLPDLSGFSDAQYDEMLNALVTANVVSSNCPGFGITDGEWSLITGAADQIAAIMGLDTGAYDDIYYGPAFALLDQPDTCGTEGPKVRGIIDLMIDMGGSSTPN